MSRRDGGAGADGGRPPSSTGRRVAVVGRGLVRRRIAAVLLAVLVSAAGCSPEPAGGGSGETGSSGTTAAPSDPAALPANAPSRFGFGREATEERIARWDIDVRPDGTGLPPGSGTVEEGRHVYLTHCVSCHGPTGVEGPETSLVDTATWALDPPSRAVGTFWPHATTLYDYVRKAMPQLTPGVLTDDQVYAVVAYLLYLNDIVPEDTVMDAETLSAVVMPAAERFVLDDREGGAGPVR